MSRKILADITSDFNLDKFSAFFRAKSNDFTETDERLSVYDDEKFAGFQKLGIIDFPKDLQKLVVAAAQVNTELTERSGKKAQYEAAKRILRDTIDLDAGIFIFHDSAGNFRFSLIYGQVDKTRRLWSDFKRFTYFVGNDQPNTTFLKQIGEGDFSSLTKIKEAFSVEKVTKAFYTEIADWYFRAVRETTFPEGTEDMENGRNIAIIRLITRLIFIWFMKERRLIPPDIFDEKKMSGLLKEMSPDKTTYYKAILQNLFFATLNTKIKDRKFRFKPAFQGKNKHYMDHGIYRYEDCFKNREDMLTVFKDIPFLNGGLFDCLDKRFDDNGKNREIRIDGFTDKEVGLNIPNFLFFSDEREVDLNADYDTKNKKYKVRGLINILSSYNFTIDENDPGDAEVALDPEMLGKVFENLLASFNPETKKTARKATGSYYTPREIVDYMVVQSLKEYFKTHLSEVSNLDDKLDRLFSGEEGNPFNEAETPAVVELIDDLRIVDPAVGSGAFPMGILNRLVFALGKLDPDNKLWEQAQIQAVEKNVPDPVAKRKLIERVKEQFAQKNSDYGRKLYLIQKCVYGVDIQQIAVEIAKLRFFISLLVDEKIDDTKENSGVEALPNLDFKLMQGNSLISEFMGVNFDAASKEGNGSFFEDEEDVLIEEFQQKKSAFQNASDRQEKDALKQQIDNLIVQIFEAKLKRQRADYFDRLRNIEEKCAALPDKQQAAEAVKREKEALYEKTGFSLEQAEKQLREYTGGLKVKPFFLWNLYFAEVFHEKGGFDIVIANPPYVRQESIKAFKPQLAKMFKNFYCGTADLYTYFYKKGIDLLRENGHLCFIAPNKFMRAGYGKNTRTLLTEKTTPRLIIDFCDLPIFDATTYPSVLLIKNREPKVHDHVLAATFIDDKQLADITQTIKAVGFKIPAGALKKEGWSLERPEVLALMEKLRETGKPLGEYVQGKFYRGVLTGLNKAFVIDAETRKQLIAEDPKSQELIKPWLRGRDIKKWRAEWAGLYIISIPSSANKEWPWSQESPERARTVFKRTYPAVYNHLSKLEDKLIKRDDQGKFWWELRSCAYYKEFEKPKIVYPDIAQSPKFTWDESKTFLGNTAYIMLTQEKWLAGLLNSQLTWWFYLNISATIRGGFVRFIAQYMEQVPIVFATDKQKASIANLVDQILAVAKDEDYPQNQAKQAKVKEYERRIDQLVYELYGLTDDEIAVVEGKNG